MGSEWAGGQKLVKQISLKSIIIKTCKMKTERRIALKKLFASLLGLTGIGLVAVPGGLPPADHLIQMDCIGYI